MRPLGLHDERWSAIITDVPDNQQQPEERDEGPFGRGEQIVSRGFQGIQSVARSIGWALVVLNGIYVVWSLIFWNSTKLLQGLGGVLLAALLIVFSRD